MAYVNTRKAVALLGVHPNTLRKWANDGRIEHIRSPGGRRLYDVDAFLREEVGVEVVLYARVSPYAQKDDLRGQVALLRCRYPGAELIKDFVWRSHLADGKAMSPYKDALNGWYPVRLEDAHKDRLARFGFELVEWLAKQTGASPCISTSQSVALNKNLLRIFYPFSSTFSCRLGIALASTVTKSRKIRIYRER